MESIKKQNIATALSTYCERYESQTRAANSLKNVSAATISQMVNGKWDMIKDDMWRNVAAQIGHIRNERRSRQQYRQLPRREGILDTRTREHHEWRSNHL